jgi:hypothetical protein
VVEARAQTLRSGATAGDAAIKGLSRSKRISGASRVVPWTRRPAASSTQRHAWAFRPARSRNCRVVRKLPLPYLTPASTIPFLCGLSGGHGSILKPRPTAHSA